MAAAPRTAWPISARRAHIAFVQHLAGSATSRVGAHAEEALANAHEMRLVAIERIEQRQPPRVEPLGQTMDGGGQRRIARRIRDLARGLRAPLARQHAAQVRSFWMQQIDQQRRGGIVMLDQ